MKTTKQIKTSFYKKKKKIKPPETLYLREIKKEVKVEAEGIIKDHKQKKVTRRYFATEIILPEVTALYSINRFHMQILRVLNCTGCVRTLLATLY